MENNKEQKQIQVQTSPDHKPVFSNSVQISVSDDSVVPQFLFIRPNAAQATLISEVVLTPKHAINFQKSLDTTIKQHFTKHLDSKI